MLDINNIIFIEKENNSRSSTIYYGNDKMVTTESLQLLEEKLSSFNQFLRSHKSYIINKNKIKSIEYESKTSDIIKFWGCDYTALIIKQKKKLL